MWRKLMVVGAIAIGASAIVDSAGAEPSTGALPPDVVDVVSIAGRYGVPADASMVAATVTAIDPGAAGWIKAYPCDTGEPETANLNYVGGETANNLVFARLSPAGKLCIATRSISDYVIDLAGFVPAGSDLEALHTPRRALDTRTTSTDPSPLPDGTTVTLQLGGEYGIPDDAGIAVFNLTAVGGPNAGRVTAHPCDEVPGTTSSVNFPAGRNIPNLVVSRLAADGTVCFLTKNEVDIVVDVAAYASDGITTLPTPVRIADTRDDPGLLAARTTTVVDPELPDEASAAVFNLASVGAPSRGFAVAHPCDEQRPTASNLNYLGAGATSTGAITKLAADGTFCLFNRTATELIVDLVGYTSDESVYTPLTPVRIKDTRRCPVLVVPEMPADETARYAVRHLTTGAVTFADVTGNIFWSPFDQLPTVTGGCSTIVGSADICCHTGGTTVESPLFSSGGEVRRWWPAPTALLDDGRLITASYDGVWELVPATDENAQEYPTLATIGSDLVAAHTAVSRDGRWMVLMSFDGQSGLPVEVWNIERDERVARFDAPRSARWISISDDGRLIAFNSHDEVPDSLGTGSEFVNGTIHITDLHGREIDSVSVATGSIEQGRFTGRGTIVACHWQNLFVNGGPAVVRYAVNGELETLETMATSPLFGENFSEWREQCTHMVAG